MCEEKAIKQEWIYNGLMLTLQMDLAELNTKYSINSKDSKILLMKIKEVCRTAYSAGFTDALTLNQ